MMNEEKVEIIKPNTCFGIRHLQVLMLFLAMFLSYAMRVNMSLGIVVMTDLSNENSFDWSSQIQSVILSSFFWAYAPLQIPAGEMANKLGSNRLLAACVGINALMSLLTPPAAYVGGWIAVCACRVVQGLIQGVLFPAIHNFIGKWIPLDEKSRLATMIYSGAQLGTAVQLIASGFIASSWGWPGIFYLNGVLGTIWTIVYMIVGAASPQESRLISESEKTYIKMTIGQVSEQKKLKTPWKAIFTSLPFWSLIAAHCGNDWGLWTLMTQIPSYINQVLGVDITENGIMSALPYLAMYLMSFPLAFLADYLLMKNLLSVTASRKISNSIGQWGPAIALIALSYAPADATVAVAILTVVVGLNAGHYTGYQLVHIDMSPNFAGTLMGITNCFANIVSITAPLVAGAILTDQSDVGEWRIVFFLAAGIYFVANLFFVLFGTSEIQDWNEPEGEPLESRESTFEKKAEQMA